MNDEIYIMILVPLVIALWGISIYAVFGDIIRGSASSPSSTEEATPAPSAKKE